MINVVKTALTHFGRDAVVARRAAGETYSEIQIDAFGQRDASAKALIEAALSQLPTGTEGRVTEKGITIEVPKGNAMNTVLKQLDELVPIHGALFFARGCQFERSNIYSSVTSFELLYNTDHA